MSKIYLVGVVWFSSDQGDWPNNYEFPSCLFDNLEDAEAKYEELAKGNSTWTCGFQEAYLAEAIPGQPGIKVLKGHLRI